MHSLLPIGLCNQHPITGELAENSMHLMSWLGIALVVCWAVLWFSVKLAAVAVHLLLLLGIVFLVMGFMRGRANSRL